MEIPKKKRTRAGRPTTKIISQRIPPEIDMSQVVFWIEGFATVKEIAASCGVAENTLKTAIKKHFGITYQELQEKHSSKGVMSLRRAQLKLANTSAGMAIWLGKQYAGQHETDNRIKNSPNDMKLNKLFSIIEEQDVS